MSTAKTRKPSWDAIRKATRQYVTQLLENGTLAEWFKEFREDNSCNTEVELAVKLTHNLYALGISDQPIDVGWAVFTVMQYFTSYLLDVSCTPATRAEAEVLIKENHGEISGGSPDEDFQVAVPSHKALMWCRKALKAKGYHVSHTTLAKHLGLAE
jgi:hypothetical protein